MTKTISLSARRLSIRLGLGDLVSRPNCKGYQNCCACPECMVVANLILEHQAAIGLGWERGLGHPGDGQRIGQAQQDREQAHGDDGGSKLGEHDF